MITLFRENSDDLDQNFDRERAVSMNRRQLLKVGVASSAVLAFGGLLAACGDEDDDDVPAAPVDDTDDDDVAVDDEDTDDEPVDPDGPVIGGELIYGLSSDPPNLDPHNYTGAAATVPKLLVYSGLMRHWVDDEEHELQVDLAEDVQISDDGLEYTFNLRQGVEFHDGNPFTSEDVEATIERIQDEGQGATNFSYMQPIEEIELPDEHTVVLHLSEPVAPMLTYLADNASMIISKAFLDGGGDPDQDMIGTGPFMFDSYEPGARLELVKNESYFREGYPYLDRVILVPYPDEGTRMVAVFGGDVHIAEYAPWRDYERIREDPNLMLYTGDGAAFMYIIYNNAEEPFDDPAVRHALGYAFDRESVLAVGFFGEGSAITGGLVPPAMWGYNPDLDGTFTYDPDRAIELLAEAGYEDGFSATLMSSGEHDMHQSTAEVAQENLQDIGIDVELELLDWATTVERDSRAEYHFRVQGSGIGAGDPDFLSDFYHSSYTRARRMNFADDEVDRLLDEARQLVEQEDREPLYQEVQERLLELSPHSLLTYRVQGEAVREGVNGYEHYPGGLFAYSCLSIEKIWMSDPNN